MTISPSKADRDSRMRLGTVLLLGASVAIWLGVYGKVHTAAQRPLFNLGFSSMLPMKAWLTTLATELLAVQLITALWMWRRLPRVGKPPAWVAGLHRWSGTAAFVTTLPVAFHCLWSLGFVTSSWRVALHGFLGCFFYGAYAAKMLALRVRGLPGWTLPVLGGTVLSTLVLLWLTAALWFFTRSGIPLT
jgi:hypothetical protein